MSNRKRIDVSTLVIIAIFLLAIAGLSAVNDSFESYSVSSESKQTETVEISSQAQFFTKLKEIDSELMSFFDELRGYFK